MPQFNQTMNTDLTTRVDKSSSTYTYVGEAQPGQPSSASRWRIARIDSAGTLLYAGVGDFNHAWDNRASLVYA